MTTTAELPGTLNQPEIAYEPDLVPPLHLMAQEGILVLEDWFRWAEEWSMILRLFGGLTMKSSVLEIGCGLGRIAFPLRYVLLNGSYEGFDVSYDKIAFLERTFSKAHPNFRFIWSDVHNSLFNPAGQTPASEYRFPYPRNSFDVVFAASLFNHLLPDATANYFEQTARVLKPGGHWVFGFFLLDNYRPGQQRPFVFGKPFFDFDQPFGAYGDEFAVPDVEHPEHMAAYRLSMVKRYASQAGLELAHEPVPGLWSGSFSTWACAQDLVVLRKPTLNQAV